MVVLSRAWKLCVFPLFPVSLQRLIRKMLTFLGNTKGNPKVPPTQERRRLFILSRTEKRVSSITRTSGRHATPPFKDLSLLMVHSENQFSC